MNIELTGQGTTVTPQLREITEKKLNKLLHLSDQISSARVIFSVSKNTHAANAHVMLSGDQINAHAESDDMYKTIDLVIHKLTAQIEKHKGKH